MCTHEPWAGFPAEDGAVACLGLHESKAEGHWPELSVLGWERTVMLAGFCLPVRLNNQLVLKGLAGPFSLVTAEPLETVPRGGKCTQLRELAAARCGR